VRYLMQSKSENRPPQETLEVGWLDRYERSLLVVNENEYDQLLAAGVQ